ncbi:MAG: hypothetical protein ACR2IO_00880 [Candidatus Nanopelagicus sp.]|jgi:peptidoglycan/LPS O-acetylase OafA/YrhL
MKERVVIGGRHFAQSTCACLTAMTKGNLDAITPEHWKVALITGVGVGVFAILFTFIPRLELQETRWGVVLVAFLGTFIVDVLNHGSHYQNFWGDEALITAMGAAVLSLFVSFTPLDRLNQKIKSK